MPLAGEESRKIYSSVFSEYSEAVAVLCNTCISFALLIWLLNDDINNFRLEAMLQSPWVCEALVMYSLLTAAYL